MKNRFALALGALLLAGVGSASAADMGARKAPPMAAPIAQVYNWTGLYVGIHGGYAWGDFSGLDIDGGFFGGQIGFNWQAPGSPIVFGIELDSAWANIEGGVVTPGVGTLTSDINYQGSLRGRVGYAFNNALLYVTGGLAWMHNDLDVTVPVAPFVVGVSDDNTHFGYTIGAGLEYAFAPNWSAKVEYLYADYGAENYFSGIVPGGFDFDAQTHSVKLGLNYRFGWGAPVVARY
jgi:outer membrane immunogenic protein